VAAKRSGIEVLADKPGSGAAIKRQRVYPCAWSSGSIRARRLAEVIGWDQPWGLIDRAQHEDDGASLLSDLRIDRENLFTGLFQGIDGMCIGGRRKLKISPRGLWRTWNTG